MADITAGMVKGLREKTGDLVNWSMSFGDGEAGFWLR